MPYPLVHITHLNKLHNFDRIDAMILFIIYAGLGYLGIMLIFKFRDG